MIRTEAILAAGEGANPLLPNWWEILVTAVGFAVLMFLVVKYIAPA
ncbi:MAG: F0F1 ATP synthase subunit B, partial [Citricoccus sp.]